MPFDSDRFEGAEFMPRERSVAVPALSDFFGEGEKAEWVVRGLNSNELSKAFEAEKSRKEVSKVVEAIADAGSQAEEIRSVLGLGKGTQAEVAKRLQMLVCGSVEPEVSMPVAAKLAETFPVEFLLITNTITQLTGLGAELKKPEAVSLPMAS